MTRSIVRTATLLMLAAAPAAAQSPHLEIGADAAFTAIGSDTEPNVRLVQIPRWARLGVTLGDHWLVEASLAFTRAGSVGTSHSALEVRPSVSWMWKQEGEVRPYLGAVAEWSRLSGGGDTSSQASLGAIVGVRVPLGGPAFLRLEAGIEHAFETDRMPAANRLRLSAGVSVRVR